MYSKTFLEFALKLAAIGVMFLPAVCRAEFCDGGPAGLYCFDDLTGYHKCVFDNSTRRYVDYNVTCPKNTRCTCMGLPCTTDSPCGPYKQAPPVFTGDFTTGFDRVLIECRASKCTTRLTLYAVWQDFSNKKYRTDVSTLRVDDDPIHEYEYSILLPNKQSTFDEYDVIPSKKSCSKYTTPSYPSNLANLSFFSFNGTETVSGTVCEKWIFMAGGRTKEQPIDTLRFYIANGRPVYYHGTFPTSLALLGTEIKVFFSEYVIGTPDPEVYDLPPYCEKQLFESHFKTTLNAKYSPFLRPHEYFNV